MRATVRERIEALALADGIPPEAIWRMTALEFAMWRELVRELRRRP